MDELKKLQQKKNFSKKEVSEDVVDAIIEQSTTKQSESSTEPKPKKAKKSKADMFKKSVPRTERHSIYLTKSLEDEIQSLLKEINSDGSNKSFNDLCVDILELFFQS